MPTKASIDLAARLGRLTRKAPPGLRVPAPPTVGRPYRSPAPLPREPETPPVVRRRPWLLGIALALGLPLGYGARSIELSARERALSQQTAEDLVGYLTSSARSLANLDRALRATRDGLLKSKFPSDAVVQLSNVELLLDSTTLGFLNVALLGSKTAGLFFDYNRLAAQANASRRRLVALLTGPTAETLASYFQASRAPRVMWAAELVQAQHGVWGRLRPVGQPFLVDSPWPSRFGLVGDPAARDRYAARRAVEIGLLPIDPATLNRPHAERLLRNALLEIERLGMLVHGGPDGEFGLGTTLEALLERLGQANVTWRAG